MTSRGSWYGLGIGAIDQRTRTRVPPFRRSRYPIARNPNPAFTGVHLLSTRPLWHASVQIRRRNIRGR